MSSIVHPGLAPARAQFENGLVVLAKSSSSTPAVTLHAMCRAGTIYEPAGLQGVGHLVARLLDRGTEARSADEIADELDERGVSLAIKATRHTMTISVDCLREDFEGVLALLADVLRHPVFPDAQIALRRGETLTRLKQDEDSPAVRAGEELFSLLYGAEHPYGWRTKGTADAVERITREDLLQFHRRWFAPSRTSLAIVGDIDEERAVDAAGRAFGHWNAVSPVEPPLPPPAPRTAREMRTIPMPSKAQADIACGFVTVTRLDPAYHAWSVMNTILGQYGIGGRIGDDVRERQGLAYYAYTSFDPHLIPGPLVVRAGVDGANVDRALATIDAQIANMAANGPTDEEIADTKRFLIGSLPRTLETNAGIAFFLQTAEHFGLGLDYDVRLPALIDAVTRDAAHDAARHLSPERAAVVVAGPYDGSAPRG